jgi:hypothetical protein
MVLFISIPYWFVLFPYFSSAYAHYLYPRNAEKDFVLAIVPVGPPAITLAAVSTFHSNLSTDLIFCFADRGDVWHVVRSGGLCGSHIDVLLYCHPPHLIARHCGFDSGQEPSWNQVMLVHRDSYLRLGMCTSVTLCISYVSAFRDVENSSSLNIGGVNE